MHTYTMAKPSRTRAHASHSAEMMNMKMMNMKEGKQREENEELLWLYMKQNRNLLAKRDTMHRADPTVVARM